MRKIMFLAALLIPACDVVDSQPDTDAADTGDSSGGEDSTGESPEFRTRVRGFYKMPGRPAYGINHFTNDHGWTCFYCSSGACNCEPIGGGFSAPDGNIYDGKWYPEIAP
jgi:hypothetical protein